MYDITQHFEIFSDSIFSSHYLERVSRALCNRAQSATECIYTLHNIKIKMSILLRIPLMKRRNSKGPKRTAGWSPKLPICIMMCWSLVKKLTSIFVPLSIPSTARGMIPGTLRPTCQKREMFLVQLILDAILHDILNDRRPSWHLVCLLRDSLLNINKNK